ncbi:MAG: hypothetical protein QXP36_12275 [Conexivisphaerales archaeon]
MDQRDFIEIAKHKFANSVTEEDSMYKLLDIYDSLTKSENLLFQSINSLLLLYFPKLSTNLTLNDALRIERIDNVKDKDDYGAELKDKVLIDSFLSLLKEIDKAKAECLAKIEDICKRIFPNSSSIIEPLILARMLKTLGGSKEIPKLTLSKLQSIGNPKSFYKRPSFGIISNSSLIINKKSKIKAMRKLSEYLMITLKIDVFRKKKDDSVISEFQKAINDIK